MKIGMMCLWNAANGPAIHAELVGKAWIELGHKLSIFSANKHPDARPTLQKDEAFVMRHFHVNKVIPFTRAASFDPAPLLNEAYEVFVAQNLERLPADKLLEIFPEIRKKAITVLVVHEGKAPDDPLYYKFDWDAIVCFDQRYKDFLLKFFPEDKIHMIPYPYHKSQFGDKKTARKKLGFPLDHKIVFSFGFRPQDIMSVLPTLKDLNETISFKYVITANPDSDIDELRNAQKAYPFVELQVKALTLQDLYTYLYASDALLIHRNSSQKYPAVVSSSICQVLGSGCPILFHESNYVALHGDEIWKYQDFDALKTKLTQLFKNHFDHSKVETFLGQHNAQNIASRYLELFKNLIKNRNRRSLS